MTLPDGGDLCQPCHHARIAAAVAVAEAEAEAGRLAAEASTSAAVDAKISYGADPQLPGDPPLLVSAPIARPHAVRQPPPVQSTPAKAADAPSKPPPALDLSLPFSGKKPS